MSLLTLFKTTPVAEPSGADRLEDVLIDLARYGQPRVGMYGNDGTWCCSLEANVTPLGAKFEVRSDFKHPSPTAAALQCRDRLRAALVALGQGAIATAR